MSEELTLLQKLMTPKPPTRRITLFLSTPMGNLTSKPPTRRITEIFDSHSFVSRVLHRDFRQNLRFQDNFPTTLFQKIFPDNFFMKPEEPIRKYGEYRYWL